MSLTDARSALNIVDMKRSVVSRVMREMGRKGGKAGGAKGGRRRMAALTPEERSALGRKAAAARWGDRNKQQKAAPQKPGLKGRRAMK